jgi:hypothetical protein
MNTVVSEEHIASNFLTEEWYATAVGFYKIYVIIHQTTRYRIFENNKLPTNYALAYHSYHYFRYHRLHYFSFTQDFHVGLLIFEFLFSRTV